MSNKKCISVPVYSIFASVGRPDDEVKGDAVETGLVNLLETLEEQKTDLLSQVERWPPEKLNHKAGAAEWSVLEMIDHIVKTEAAILSAARAGLARPQRIGIGDRLRTAFLQKIFASDRKVKVPVSARHVLPGPSLQLAEIRARWNEGRDDLHRFVRRSDPDLLRKGIFKHPVGGWMGMQQILLFFSSHLIHHRYQLNRIARSARVELA